MQATLVEGIGVRLRDSLGGRTYQWLSDQTGISTSMLSDYGKGAKTPGADKAVLIADALGVEISWLLTGRGNSTGRYFLPSDIIEQYGLKPGSSLRHPNSSLADDHVSADLSADHTAADEPKMSADADLVEIDQVDLRFGMGATYLDGPVETEKRVFSRSWLRNFTRSAPEQLFWTLGDGDSMEPTIRSGEVILIDRSQDTLRSADGIWAVTVGDIVQVKRLRPRANGSVEILSDNPAVPPDLAVDGELHVIGRVVAVVRRL